MPDTSLLPLASIHRFAFPCRSKGEYRQSHLSGADAAVVPVGYEGDMPFASCLRGARGEDENRGMWHGVSPPAPWGSPTGEGKANGTCWCGESVSKLPALQQPTILMLRKIKVYKQCQREFFSEESLLMQF